MEIESHLTRESTDPRELLLSAFEYFGDVTSMAQRFDVQPSTVERWLSGAGGRIPGSDIRTEMQNYLPGQSREVYITGEMRESGRERELYITLNREDNIQYSAMLAQGKEKAAEVFLIASQHGEWQGAPALVGADWYPEDEDYYDDPDYQYEYDDYVLV